MCNCTVMLFTGGFKQTKGLVAESSRLSKGWRMDPDCFGLFVSSSSTKCTHDSSGCDFFYYYYTVVHWCVWLCQSTHGSGQNQAVIVFIEGFKMPKGRAKKGGIIQLQWWNFRRNPLSYPVEVMAFICHQHTTTQMLCFENFVNFCAAWSDANYLLTKRLISQNLDNKSRLLLCFPQTISKFQHSHMISTQWRCERVWPQTGCYKRGAERKASASISSHPNSLRNQRIRGSAEDKKASGLSRR